MRKLITILALGLMMTACAPHTAGVMASSTGEVRVDNGSFAGEVSVEQLKSRQQGGFLQGSGLIISKVATDLRLQYKFTWYDINGYTLDDEGSAWKSLKLHGKQQMQVSGLAPNTDAVRYELYVRKAFSN
ncbi:YcfL family protein [Shewanella nanhaiensis]|uniref:YcfL family protein n=1 Tax=Shewanella nanhaiensis TaxID=2864872 RepID=A0ABS7E270_9GAMM|nr:YcfL family protein [Shewanella nanhaiensis]MBW8183756.1 YcfL family protein [Shewanella nanhaiensis]